MFILEVFTVCAFELFLCLFIIVIGEENLKECLEYCSKDVIFKNVIEINETENWSALHRCAIKKNYFIWYCLEQSVNISTYVTLYTCDLIEKYYK